MNGPTLSRRFVLAGLLTSAASCSLADAPERSLRPAAKPLSESGSARHASGAEALIEAAKLDGKVGFVVADSRTGQVLESHNPLLPLPPASTAKAITALFALERLGPGFRYATEVIATGPVAGGVVQGDIVLAGSGDPTLDTNRLAELAQRMRRAGVTGATGRIRVWEGALPSLRTIDAEQPDHVGYSPGISGLNLNFNRVHFEWKRAGSGYSVTMDARSDKYRPPVRTARMDVSNRDLPVYTYEQQGGVDRWTVASKALGKGGSRWLPVRNPGAYAGEVFHSLAAAQGIRAELGEPVSRRPQGTVLAQVLSDDLSTILRDMLQYSTNITAEVVGMTAAGRGGSMPRSLRESGAGMARWLEARVGANKARFVDHSGLGAASEISCREMVEALTVLSPKLGLRSLLKPIPMRNSAGQVLDGHPLDIVAKTGTLNFVSALAGYVRAPDGTDLAFAMFMADEPRRNRLSKAERESPQGASAWNGRAKNLQLRLIERWGALYTG
ncbi:D-alanyl-D-alanine carboxypeptidase/D-alanyl-D-alanine endopeptidase [Vannielia litorea]|uniref:D-alanyl-D-alanine carboxypeptidase / D-alanyl-D-alanine-endopeptidase (Penicillin-binding protein 4) n=1 Tax=Vannielia litorea TaxID=1217970 RepID=A0A1N6DXP4_9RHOB|nr:D-alanyl-D-alanine carboxypeptidase/D-alanyl-D-alanine-endopeptidase [Vannielia litorea]SIN75511.1 D-alanyl-D-alanine carboxypeptidase / D-alanyl-D-alanine-endopeptidase (penicillin-binding protein 4) [Vannielia litorea]